MNYYEFLQTKKITKKTKGIEINIKELNNKLFDFQKVAVQQALKKGRYLLAEECGLGKTFQQLEWAYHIHKLTRGNVLILAPLGVAKQTASEEAIKLGYVVNICRTQKDVIDGINITNYEMIEHFDGDKFIGVVLDESSILKNYTGKTRMLLKEKFINTPYKLCCSATPAPNEFMELLNQADFLGIMDTAKALATYFINDFKTGLWRLKGHATDIFWEWVCSWALMIDKPSDIGFNDDKYNLPKLNIHEHILEIDLIDNSFEDGFIREINMSATGFHNEKRETAEARAKKCAELVNSNDEQFIVWCDTNLEADLLKQYIPSATEIRGSHSTKIKEDATDKFKSGEIRVLISKPSIFGYGMNFQKCHNVVFCGLTYSYEDYYQALKRTYRFGQENEVHVYIVLGATEKRILEIVREKEAKQVEIKNQMNKSIKDIQRLEIEGKEIMRVNSNIKVELPSWL